MEASSNDSNDDMVDFLSDLSNPTRSSTVDTKHIDYKERRKQELEESRRAKEAEYTFTPTVIRSGIDSPRRTPLYPSKSYDEGEVVPLTPREQMRLKLEAKKAEESFDFKPKINNEYKPRNLEGESPGGEAGGALGSPTVAGESKFDKLYKDAISRKQHESAYKDKQSPSFVPKLVSRRSSRNINPSPSADGSSDVTLSSEKNLVDKLYSGQGVSRKVNEKDKKQVETFSPTISRRASLLNRAADGDAPQRLYKAALDWHEKKKELAAKIPSEYTFSPTMKSSEAKRSSSVGRYGDNGGDVVSRNQQFIIQRKQHIESIQQERAMKEIEGVTFNPQVSTRSYTPPPASSAERQLARKKSTIVKENETFSFTPSINAYPVKEQGDESASGLSVFERLHQEDRRRKEAAAEVALLAQQRELEECTFVPAIPQSSFSSSAVEGGVGSTRVQRDLVRRTSDELAELTFVPKVNEYAMKDGAESTGLSVHERLVADVERSRERKKHREEAHIKAQMEHATFVPSIPEVSRRMSAVSGAPGDENKTIFERLAQKQKAIPISKSAAESSVGSYADRSLHRSKSISAVPSADLTASKAPLTPEEQEQLYSRLTERARDAAERLRLLRADAEAGTTSTISSETNSTYASFSDRSLFRSKSIKDRSEAPPAIDKTPLSSEEKDTLYARLTERAKEAAQRLKDLRQNPELGTESAVSSALKSSYGSFKDRSLFRSKSAPRNTVSPPPPEEKPPLSAEEQEQLFSRLVDRARKEAIKIREIKTTVPLAGVEYSGDSAKPAFVAEIGPEKQAVFARLAMPKKPSISAPVDSPIVSNLVDSRGLVRTPSKESPLPSGASRIPKRANSIRVTPQKSPDVASPHSASLQPYVHPAEDVITPVEIKSAETVENEVQLVDAIQPTERMSEPIVSQMEDVEQTELPATNDPVLVAETIFPIDADTSFGKDADNSFANDGEIFGGDVIRHGHDALDAPAGDTDKELDPASEVDQEIVPADLTESSTARTPGASPSAGPGIEEY